MKKPLLEVENLRCYLQTAVGRVRAVDGISFAIYPGETFALLGESGCGKSMTGLCLTQLYPDNAYVGAESVITFQGKDLLTCSEIEMRAIRGRKIAMIFQEPMTALNPVRTIAGQLEEVLLQHTTMNKAARQARMLSLLTQVGLPDGAAILRRYPHQLSGGMQQRAVIAMALAVEPDLLIADEPTTALDVTIQAQIIALLQTLQRQMGMAVLLISHDLAVVSQMADRVAVMYAGHFVEVASKSRLLSAAEHPYSRQLFAALPDSRKRGAPLAVLPGAVPKLTAPQNRCRFLARCPLAQTLCYEQPPEWIALNQEHAARCHFAASGLELTEREQSSPVMAESPVDGEPLLSLDKVCVQFSGKRYFWQRHASVCRVVDGISLVLVAGKTTALVGESGCGKTTLAKTAAGLLPFASGRINLHVKTGVLRTSDPGYRQAVQMVFQDPYGSLNPRLTVGDIVAEGLQAQNPSQSRAAQRTVVDSVLQQVGLLAEHGSRYPHEFSGGQRQRIALARALAVQPTLLICDEPTSALDVSVQAQILNLLQALQRDLGMTYLFITHDIATVSYLADTVAVMYLGRIVESGPVAAILQTPQHPYTQSLLQAVPTVSATKSSASASGCAEMPSPSNPPPGCHFAGRCPHAMPLCRREYPKQCTVRGNHQVSCHLYQPNA